METGNTDYMKNPIENNDLQWWFVTIICVAIFLIHHHPMICLDIDWPNKVGEVAGAIDSGSIIRPLGIFGLLFACVWRFFVTRPHRIRMNGLPAWLALFFLVWVIASVAWAGDTELAFRRIATYCLLFLSASALAMSLTPFDFTRLCFLVTFISLIFGIAMEVALGAFHPLAAGYRFCGSLHPNHQAIYCGILLLTSLSLARDLPARKAFYIAVAMAALAFLVLTRSRNAFAAALLAFGAHFALTSSRKRIFSFSLLSVCGALFLALVFNDRLARWIGNIILLGRVNEGNISALSGRTELWKEAIKYLWVHPFLGYGFSAFFTPEIMSHFSRFQGWTIPELHCAYLDIALGVGIIGLAVFVFIYVASMLRMKAWYQLYSNESYSAFCAIILFAMLDALMETTMINPEFPTFVVLAILSYGCFCQFHDPDAPRDDCQEDDFLPEAPSGDIAAWEIGRE